MIENMLHRKLPLVAGFFGQTLAELDSILPLIEHQQLSGVILYDHNIKNPEQLRELTHALQSRSPSKLLIFIDQEGGHVARLRPDKGFIPTISAAEIGQTDDSAFTTQIAEELAKQLAYCGVNVNCVPVLDLNINPNSPIIGARHRCFSDNTSVVTRHAKIFIETLNRHGITAVAKHFPGHGSSITDSHVAISDITETWKEEELAPYQNLCEILNDNMIMIGHLIHRGLDPSGEPATLSPTILKQLLRKRLGFKGIIIADDIQMRALGQQYDFPTALKKLLSAGNDLLIFSQHTLHGYNISLEEVLNALEDLIENLYENNSHLPRHF